MKELELSPRLASVARCIPQGCVLADVGTDHAYLPVWLILQGRITHAVASDLRSGPLARAQATGERYGVSRQITFRLCDGLQGISPDGVDVVSIAGMGGETIAEILSHAPWTRDRLLVLQPMSSLPELRRWLQKNGYQISLEHVTTDHGTIYTTMTVTGGSMPLLTAGEQYAGRPAHWAKEPLRGEYLTYLLAKAKRELEGVERSSKEFDRPRREELRQIISELTLWKGEWEHANSKPDL